MYCAKSKYFYFILEDNSESKFFAVGFWNEHSISLYSLKPEINQMTKEKIGGDVLPRSILLVSMEMINYLLVALGDGTIFYFKIDILTGFIYYIYLYIIKIFRQFNRWKKSFTWNSTNYFKKICI